jgi:hypothetical protein
MVRILHRVANQAKKAAFKETLVSYTLFQEKWQPLLQTEAQ